MLNNLGGLSSQSNDRQDSILFTMPHDTSTPYCDNRNCDCHTSVEWHDKITSIPQHSDEEVRSAFRYFGLIAQ